MAGKEIADILKIVEFLKNGLAGVCLFLVAYNLLQLFLGKGSRREIIHAFLWAVLASVVVMLSDLGKKVWGKLEPQVIDAMAKGVRSSWLSRPRGFKKRYYEHLIYKYRSYRTQGLKTKGPFSLDLEKIFVPLRLLPESASKISSALIQRQTKEGKLELWNLLEKRLPEDLVFKPIVIIGAPGTGKTTLMEHVSLTFAQEAQGANILKLMPILIYLRNEREKIAEDISLSLAKLIVEDEEIKGLDLTEAWFEDQLSNHQCLVMLDGLDEVADEQQRKKVRDWVERQIIDYPKAKFIVTSRPPGYESAPLEGVDVLEVLPFTWKQVEEFIENWYLQNEIRFQRKDDWGVRREAKYKSQDLIERIQQSVPIVAMATNPLLLTMIAVVHDNRGALPGRRVELYGEICDVLLGRRQEAKGIPDRLTPAQKQSILQVLALELMKGKTREFKVASGVDIIRNKLLKIADREISPSDFLKLIREVSALLVETKQGILEFAHKSFQEYLAAVQIKEDSQENILTSNIDDSWWDETIRLYAAQSDATNLITAALEKNTVGALKLALDCAEEGLSVDTDVRQQLKDKLEAGLESSDREIFNLAAEVMLARRLSQFMRIDENREIDPKYISCAEYQLFLDESKRGERFPSGNAKKPITVTSWREALNFGGWLTDKMNSNLGEQEGQKEKYYYRLPTSAEVQDDPAKEHQELKCWSMGENSVTELAIRLIRTKSPALYEFEVVTVGSNGQETQKERCYAQYITENLTSNISLEMVYVPGGSFMMGAPEKELESSDWEKPQHQVTVPSFYMGRYPITQAQWKAVAGWEQIERELNSDPSNFQEDYEGIDRWTRPVEQVSWDDAKEFCDRLSKKTGREYRLPTEAEWEYACRAGTDTPFHFGETITTDLANYRGTDNESMGRKGSYGDGPQGEYREQTTPVGYFNVANNFGLYDMHGNVWEWCQDNWHDNYQGAPNDGSAWVSGVSSKKVIHSGSWDFNPLSCRSAIRFSNSRAFRSLIIGFRVVCVVPRTT
ncbi:MAG: SUMF1/EgtB/PvdO family nonheme iron enzyme [Pleurocapsa sp. MO_192.B19]|nr:SUMF1/EgtB/PvdO family nonheme iron enzyme [Pleurocapsa sp. MO_192.B19]